MISQYDITKPWFCGACLSRSTLAVFMGELYTVAKTPPLNAYLSKMRTAYRLTLIYIIVATLATVGASGVQQAKPKVNLGRFALRGEGGFDSSLASRSLTGDVSEAEAHALWLTSRKPTRRSKR